MLAVPTMAQVDWSILGDTGSSACPEGQSQIVGLVIPNGSVKKHAVQFATPSISLGELRVALSNPSLQSAVVYLSVLKNGREEASRQTLGTAVAGTSIVAGTQNFSGLKQNTKYTGILHAGNVSSPILRVCFKTAADLEIPLGSGRGGDGPGDSWSSGCYAFSKDPNQIRACFCGARNSSGSWARTDAEDGYEYMMDAAWRQSVGCTTN